VKQAGSSSTQSPIARRRRAISSSDSRSCSSTFCNSNPGEPSKKRLSRYCSAVLRAPEEFPIPDMELVDRRFYRRMGRESAVVVAGRGCPLGCSYCAVGGAAWLPHRLRPVDRVIVKGKTEPVEIFTPEEDAEVVRLSRVAIDAYRRRDWDGSEAAWARIVERRPEDGVAAAYLARIAEWRRSPPAGDWSGSIALDKL